MMVCGLAVGGRGRGRLVLRTGRETERQSREGDDGENTHFRVSPPSLQVACDRHVVGRGNL